jgi:DnaJ-class molecular chaperone
MTKMERLTINGKVFDDCPKCKGEGTMFAVSHLKWGKVAKWQHFARCQMCNFETAVK